MTKTKKKTTARDEQTKPISNKKRILVEKGLFTVPSSDSDTPRLIGSKCMSCGEVFIPKGSICLHCQSFHVEEILVGPRGQLYSFTNVNHAVPEGYRGPIPYGVGLIAFPEGAMMVSYLTESDPEKLEVGMEMEMIVDKLFNDEDGSEIIGFKFKPV